MEMVKEEKIDDLMQKMAELDSVRYQNKKCYILDTNILIEDPEAIYKFDEHTVMITDVTLEELDNLKTINGETGYMARKAIRNISSLREKGEYLHGIILPNGGVFRVIQYRGNAGHEVLEDTPDNRILITVKKLSAEEEYEEYILVTNDVAVQVKASVMEIEAQGYRNLIVKDTKYKGRTVIETDNYELIDVLRREKCISLDKIQELCPNEVLEVNQYILLKSGNNSVLAVVNNLKQVKVLNEKELRPCDVTPKNNGQKFAIHALMMPPEEVPLVVLKGPAGCAKTFLALAAGLDGVFDKKYNKVIITRNNVLSDNEIGFLKGTLDDKMSPLLAPFYDNLETILRGRYGKEESANDIMFQIEDLKESGVIEIASMAYMRGRSLSNSWIIVDEIQNATPRQILTIVTRIGEGSKLILCGDPDQIDASHLDKKNNGLVFVSEKMKGSPLCAQVTFDAKETVRSPLASEAAIRMTI